MTNSANSLDLGPLPKSDANAELQRRSIKHLNAFLKDQDSILFRDERVEDYGVDGSFELKIDGQITNFRSQVQLKATTLTQPNADGSISLPVFAANLNYLLNGTLPIYLLFDSAKSEFWYAWGHDESRRLTEDYPSWKNQQTITLRFTHRLSADTLPLVVDRLLREGRMHREIHDSLARATANEPVVVRIDAESLSITDPAKALHILLPSGPALVAAGFPKHTLELFNLVDSQSKALARLQLTAGYAEYMLGKYYNALGHIGQALATSNQLSERENNFLQLLKDASEFQVGIIDSTIYQQRMTQRTNSLHGIESLQAQMEQIRHRLLTERGEENRGNLADNIRTITAQICNHADATPQIKLSARLASLYVEGVEVTIQAIDQVTLARMRVLAQSFQVPDLEDLNRRLNLRQSEWENSSTNALREAYDLKHPILIGDALNVVSSIRLFQLVNKRFYSKYRNQSFKIPPSIASGFLQLIKNAEDVYELNGVIEGVLRTKMLRADFLELNDDLVGAKKIACEIYPVAKAMCYVDIIERAKNLLDDKTTIMEFEREWKKLNDTDIDVSFSTTDDNQLLGFARELIRIDQIPSSRLPIVEQYCKSLREIAHERTHWCRHMQMLENLEQTRDPNTAFITAPNRQCMCEKHGYETNTVTPNATFLIQSLKEFHCTGCNDRSPKTLAGRAHIDT